MPKVSVLTPVYKTPEAYLRAAVESILAQSFTDFEFIVLDDCPEDTAAEAVIRSYDDTRLRYCRNEKNLGIAGSRNKLIDMAGGEYLAIFDHDDVSVPERLEKEAAYLDTHQKCGCVSGWFELMCRHKGRVRKREADNKTITKRLRDKCVICHSACMLRRSVLDEYHIRYDPAYSPAEDYALFMKLRGKTAFHNLQEVMILYRNHEENTSHLQREQMHRADAEIRAAMQAQAERRQQLLKEIRALEAEIEAAAGKDTWKKQHTEGMGWKRMLSFRL